MAETPKDIPVIQAPAQEGGALAAVNGGGEAAASDKDPFGGLDPKIIEMIEKALMDAFGGSMEKWKLLAQAFQQGGQTQTDGVERGDPLMYDSPPAVNGIELQTERAYV
jgi:hypothetical protein